jgi:hypothetical protein
MIRRLTWFNFVAVSVMLMGCCTTMQDEQAAEPIHPADHRQATGAYNQYGGWREACGELPPLVGDDC